MLFLLFKVVQERIFDDKGRISDKSFDKSGKFL